MDEKMTTGGARVKCAHADCKCMAGADSKYCSPHCEQAGLKHESTCGCGHPGCR